MYSSKVVLARFSLLVTVSVLAAMACYEAPVATTSSPPTVATARLGPPILAESQAMAAAVKLASVGMPELERNEGEQVRSRVARLMTLEEYEDRFMQGRSYRERDLPVWAVQLEGKWRDAGIVPPESRQTYANGLVVLDARTGEQIAASFGFEPVPLEEAAGLDPEAFARYPLEVSPSYAREVVDFPVSEPEYLPERFSLDRANLELAHPMQETLPYAWMPNQSLILRYSDGQGRAIQISRSRAGQPHLIAGAEAFNLRGVEAWRGTTPEGTTWVGWTATYPSDEPIGGVASVTYILVSPDGLVTTDLLQQVAESLPPGHPPSPTATPAAIAPDWAPTAAPTATSAPPYPTATPAPMPTPAHPIGPAAEIGKPYPFSLYVHCGVRQASFDRRDWIATPILRDGSGSPPPGWSKFTEQGTMMLVREDLLRFTSSTGQAAEFRPLAPGEDYPWGPCA